LIARKECEPDRCTLQFLLPDIPCYCKSLPDNDGEHLQPNY
jgi:hypothetical protein